MTASPYRQEVLETICGKVQVVHETEEPCSPIGTSLAQSFPDTGASLATIGRIVKYALVCHLSLLRAEPASLKRSIGEEVECRERNTNGDSALDNE